MQFPAYLKEVSSALGAKDGQRLGDLLSNTGVHAVGLFHAAPDNTRDGLVRRFGGQFASPWDEICISHLLVVIHTEDRNPEAAYDEQALLTKLFIDKVFQVKPAWTLAALYRIIRDLRQIALEGDDALRSSGKAPRCSEDAARHCNKAFTACVTDRAPLTADSRKWGIYHVVNETLKAYFRVNKINLHKNVIRVIQSTQDIPPLESYPLEAQVTYRYHQGILAFLHEDYVKAETELTFAFENCPEISPRNLERILTFLVPLRILKGCFPSATLREEFPFLDQLYGPFIDSIKRADIVRFDEVLAAFETRLVQINVWLIIVKAREAVISRIFRKAWIAQGKPSQVGVRVFHTALEVAQQNMDVAEAECLLANAIHKGYIKGYISHEKQVVVLAKTNPFPSLSSRTL